MARLDASRTSSRPGLFGREPRVAVREAEIQLWSSEAERPRWWMSRARRDGLATYRSARILVGPAFSARVAADGDELFLGLTANATLRMSLHRQQRCLLAIGDRNAVRAFPEWEAPAQQAVLPRAGETRSMGQLEIGCLAYPNDQEAATTNEDAFGADLIYFAVRRESAVASEDAAACASCLAKSRLMTEPW
jgi:hypothetical protein